MKAAVVLSILSVLACGLASADTIQHETGLARERKQDRTASCSTVCVDGAGTNSSSSNWVVQINVNVYLVYNSDLNYLIIVNASTGFAILISGSNNIAIIININTGASIYVSLKTGAALYVAGTGQIAALLSVTTVYSASVTLFNTIAANAANLSGNVSLTTGFYFSLSGLVVYLSKSADITLFLQGRASFAAALQADFGVFFGAVYNLVISGAIGIADSFAIFIAPVLGLTLAAGTTIKAIYQFFVAVVIKLNGAITQALLAAFYLIVAIETIKLEILLAVLTSAIHGVGLIYADVTAALAAFTSNTVATVNQAIVTVGQVVYTIYSAIQASNTWFFRIKQGLLDIYFLYNASANIFIVYNANIKYALVFLGAIGVYAVVNVALGATIAVAKNVAVYGTTNSSAIISAFESVSVDLYDGSGVLVSVTKSLYASIGTSSSTFDFNGALQASAAGGLVAFFVGKAALLASLQASFGLVFNVQFSYSASLLGFSIVSLVLGGLSADFVSGFGTFLKLTFDKLGGFFTVAFFYIVFLQLLAYVAAGFAGAVFGALNFALNAIIFAATSFAAVAAIVATIAASLSISISF